MSEDQKDQTITEIAKGVKTIKFWWPVAMAICVIIGAAVTVTSTYDNKVAKKDDIKEISKQLTELNNQVSELSIRFNAYKIDASDDRAKIKIKVDSIGRVVKHLGRVAFVMEVKRHGPNNLPTVIPIK